jgi:hypothetical protein
LLQGDIQAANAELPKLAAQLCEARTIYHAEVKAAQEARFAELKTELAGHLHQLDTAGWNPASERAVYEIFAAFRQVHRCGQSWERLNATIESLKNRSVRAPKVTWSSLIHWVKEAA